MDDVVRVAERVDVRSDKLVNLLRHRADGYGALRQTSVTAIALDCAAARIEYLENCLAAVETRFWSIVDRDGLAPVPSDMWDALDRISKASEPHEVFWVKFSGCGQHISKWSRSPFEGGRVCRAHLAGDAQ